ncbi:hypothetical protein LXA43DRAFT_1105319 [Ganoderma leucocontextum]|nr:hypothetical protein LXA43DRAFT_1105319 [Ganoderma leucocontextum]
MQPPSHLLADCTIITNRDDTFWYTDGNVVIRVGDTVFKLHRSRLQRNCEYFKTLFDSGTRVDERIEACAVYNVPTEVTPEGFKAILIVIEMPLDDITSKLTHTTTISLLEAAHTLSCNAALRLAKTHLRMLWDSRPVPPQLDPGDIRSCASIIATIHLAREHKVSYILKRAFYELLSNEEYWHIYYTDRDSIDLSSSDRERLLCARDILGKLWREFALTPPEAAQPANAVNRPSTALNLCCYSHKDRRHMWWSSIVEKDDLESGALDPLRYNIISLRWQELQNEWWCRDCLRNKERAWKEKAVEWWKLLEDLLQL